MMNNNKFILTLLGIVALIAVLCKVTSSNTKEGYFLNYPMSYKVDRVEATPQGMAAYQGDYFSTPGFQSNLAPRFANLQMGSLLNYNLPDKQFMAAPKNPLGDDYTVMEGFVENPPSCGMGGTPCSAPLKNPPGSMMMGAGPPLGSSYGGATANYTAGNYGAVQATLPSMNITSQLPAGRAMAMDSQGQVRDNVITYDRFLPASLRGRAYGRGDYIRGDLAIAPILSVGNPNSPVMFRPSVTVRSDLNQGAMNVLTGQNEGNTRLSMLINDAQAGTLSTFAGAPYVGKNTRLGAGGGDVKVSAFP